MWQKPWGYTEGWVICAGLTLTGIVLQLTVGRAHVQAFHYPTNLIAGILYMLFLLFLHVYSRRANTLRWFSGPTASVTAIASLLLAVIVRGFTNTLSWPFILLFLYFLTILGLVILRKISTFRLKKDIGFALNHLGLFIALAAATLGSGDLQRLQMTTTLNSPEWRATNEQGELVELPLAIELTSFTIDEYPPQLLLIDNATGAILPPEHPAGLSIENCPVRGTFLNWEVEVTDYLPSAAAIITKDTTVFKAYHTEGSTSALYVKARNNINNNVREGWISSGNYQFPHISLRLDDDVSLLMPAREPKRYTSSVTLYTQEGDTQTHTLEVNHPLSVSGWKVYQLSYDRRMGKWSRTSILELVKDPWLPITYAGIILMLAGAVYLFISAPVKSN
jgi:hypothetical protein